jgi:hypothetical protein
VSKPAPFSDEWFELWLPAAADIGHDAGPSGSWATVVRYDDDTTRSFTYVFDDGAITSVRPGDADADVRFEMPYDAWVGRMRGERGGLGRAVLSGAVRMTGDPDAASELRRVFGNDRFRAVQRRVYDQTDWGEAAPS